MTSPPAVIDDLVVVGSSIDDNGRVDMPSGVVRAFDARTGALRWAWDPVPPNEAEPAADPAKRWRTGAANAWSILAVDPERHLVFVPTGSASPDYFGGLRPGDDKWANSVVALRAATGELAVGFPARAPRSVGLRHGVGAAAGDAHARRPSGARRGAGQQDRLRLRARPRHRRAGVSRRGTAGAEERRARRSGLADAAVPGVASGARHRQHVSADDAWGATPEDRDACRARMAGLRNDGVFTPPSLQGSLVMPGHVGGMNWSGYALSMRRGTC